MLRTLSRPSPAGCVATAPGLGRRRTETHSETPLRRSRHRYASESGLAVRFEGSNVPFHSADHKLDTDRRELRRGSEGIEVEPQVLDLLENRDRFVSKDDLVASVWGGRIVSDATLTSRIYAARKAVGDSGR